MPTPDKAGGIRDRPGKCCRVCFFIEKAGGEKDFSEKREENLKSPLAFFSESAIILKQSFPRPLEGVADIEGCDGHIHL